ncbi:MAG TPA: hypothetical protein VK304_07010 [Thermoleophilaceae bacterium]|nr:hypothetical protein [Thermoleophilaceae bacterium]
MNLACYRRLFGAAGLRVTGSGRPFFVRSRAGYSFKPRVDRPLLRGAQRMVAEHRGIPHCWVNASSHA